MLLEWEVRTFNKLGWPTPVRIKMNLNSHSIILPYSNIFQQPPTQVVPQSPTIPHPLPSRKGFSAHGSLAFLSLVWPDLVGGRHQGAAAQNLRGFA